MAKKKDAHGHVDEHSSASTKDLIDRIKEYHSDTEEAVKRREKNTAESEAAIRQFEGVEEQYFIDANGKHKTRKGRAKSYVLGKADDETSQKKAATELLYRLALEGITQEFGEAVAEKYKAKPAKLKQFITSKIRGRETFYELRNDLMANRHKLSESKLYRRFKEALAGDTLEDIVDQQEVQNELMSSFDHRKNFLRHVRSVLGKAGYDLAPETDARDALSHYTSFLNGGNRLTEEYLARTETVKKKKKEQEYQNAA